MARRWHFRINARTEIFFFQLQWPKPMKLVWNQWNRKKITTVQKVHTHNNRSILSGLTYCLNELNNDRKCKINERKKNKSNNERFIALIDSQSVAACLFGVSSSPWTWCFFLSPKQISSTDHGEQFSIWMFHYGWLFINDLLRMAIWSISFIWPIDE